MPDVIQKVPTGLLNFFRLQNGGVAPQSLSVFLQGVMDLTDLYLNDEEEVYQDAVNVPIAGALGQYDFGAANKFPGIVPANEFWYVREYSIQATIAALTTTCILQPTVQVPRKGSQPLGGVAVIAVGPSFGKGATALACISAGAADHAFWMPPGSVLGFTNESLDPLASVVNVIHAVKMIRFRR